MPLFLDSDAHVSVRSRALQLMLVLKLAVVDIDEKTIPAAFFNKLAVYRFQICLTGEVWRN